MDPVSGWYHVDLGCIADVLEILNLYLQGEVTPHSGPSWYDTGHECLKSYTDL
jgi:hypothetical protein